jgi:hypothetical protein
MKSDNATGDTEKKALSVPQGGSSPDAVTVGVADGVSLPTSG